MTAMTHKLKMHALRTIRVESQQTRHVRKLTQIYYNNLGFI